MTPEERVLWFDGARSWLELWMENITSCEDQDRAQVFRRSRFLPFDHSSLFVRGEYDPRKLEDLRHRALRAMAIDGNRSRWRVYSHGFIWAIIYLAHNEK